MSRLSAHQTRWWVAVMTVDKLDTSILHSGIERVISSIQPPSHPACACNTKTPNTFDVEQRCTHSAADDLGSQTSQQTVQEVTATWKVP